MIGTYKVIGVCLSRVEQEDRFCMVDALNKYAVELGYRLLVYNSAQDLFVKDNPNDYCERAVFDLINYEILDGMVILGNSILDDEIIQEIVTKCKKFNVPVASVDKNIPGCANFKFSYGKSFQEIIEHIIEVHHKKRIYLVGGIRNNSFSEERVQAYRSVMQAHKLPFEEDWIGYGDFWEQPTIEVMRHWFDNLKHEPPEAIVCANDTMAIAVCRYLRQIGFNVPDDIMVTGFDGIRQSEYHVPKLTTCKQDYEEMGRQIVGVFEKHKLGIESDEFNSVGFKHVYSESCGCEKLDVHNINDAIHEALERYDMSSRRMDRMFRVQSRLTNMSSLTGLPAILEEYFIFHTMVFAVNEDLFRAPDFGMEHKGIRAFSEKSNILYHRSFWRPHTPCSVRTRDITMNFEKIFERKNPVIICMMHFLDLTLGYVAIQPEFTYDECDNIQAFMYAINSALGTYHSQLHVKHINMQLTQVNNELEKLYIHDHLTGLYNRRGFYRQLKEQLALTQSSELELVIVSVDLDRLKYINDTFGHTEGDNAIVVTARALQVSCIYDEIAARIGGDEYVIAAIVHDGEQYFEGLKTRLRDYLNSYNAMSRLPYEISASIGFGCSAVQENLDIDAIMKVADDNMYADKISRKMERKD